MITVLESPAEVTVRGFVPRSLRVQSTRGTVRERIDRAVIAFTARNGVLPTEVQIDDQVFAVAGKCECGEVVLESDGGARLNPVFCDRHA